MTNPTHGAATALVATWCACIYARHIMRHALARRRARQHARYAWPAYVRVTARTRERA